MHNSRHQSDNDRSRHEGQVRSDFQTIPEELWRGRVIPTNDFEFCSPPKDLEVERGDFVVLSTRFGKDLARILGPVIDRDEVEVEQVRLIDRIANEEDLAKREELEKCEKDAYNVCRRMIEELNLAMKLVLAHYILDEQKVVFLFTAEKRIDFRELVKMLVAHFRLRIELRQIGVRDESRVVGGIAVCGRQFCCHSLTDRLAPVSIKMAKEQNLSLNSLKISGPCGRLLCCLAYEHKHYCNEREKLPQEGSRVVFDNMNWRVTEVNVLSHKINLSAAEGRRIEVPASRIRRREKGGWFLSDEEPDGAGTGARSL